MLPYEVSRKISDSKSFPDYAGGPPDEYLTDRLTDEALAFVSKSSDEPFLLVLAHYAVHTPIEAPVALTNKYREKSRDRGLSDDPESDIVIDGTGETKTAQNHPVYSGMVESVDANIGRIVAQLRESGIEDNTVVIVTSDHGGLSSRGLGNKRELATTNLPYRHGKGWLYDGGIRVPLIVSWPGRIDSPKVSARRTTGVDHYATLLELAGVEANGEQASDSVSYAQSLHGSADQRQPMFWHSSLGRPLQTGDTRSSAVIDGDWKLIQWYSLEDESIERVELFNLSEDEGERNNLADKFPAKRAVLETRLNTWKESVNARLGEFKKGGI
jgi:arylsulfatase A-like enzyme